MHPPFPPLFKGFYGSFLPRFRSSEEFSSLFFASRAAWRRAVALLGGHIAWRVATDPEEDTRYAIMRTAAGAGFRGQVFGPGVGERAAGDAFRAAITIAASVAAYFKEWGLNLKNIRKNLR